MTEKGARAERLAAALRDNLRKRKRQARDDTTVADEIVVDAGVSAVSRTIPD